MRLRIGQTPDFWRYTKARWARERNDAFYPGCRDFRTRWPGSHRWSRYDVCEHAALIWTRDGRVWTDDHWTKKGQAQ